MKNSDLSELGCQTSFDVLYFILVEIVSEMNFDKSISLTKCLDFDRHRQSQWLKDKTVYNSWILSAQGIG